VRLTRHPPMPLNMRYDVFGINFDAVPVACLQRTIREVKEQGSRFARVKGTKVRFEFKNVIGIAGTSKQPLKTVLVTNSCARSCATRREIVVGGHGDENKTENLDEIGDIGVDFDFGAYDGVEALKETAAVDKERELGGRENDGSSARATQNDRHA
jgi:hypothetical protein